MSDLVKRVPGMAFFGLRLVAGYVRGSFLVFWLAMQWGALVSPRVKRSKCLVFKPRLPSDAAECQPLAEVRPFWEPVYRAQSMPARLAPPSRPLVAADSPWPPRGLDTLFCSARVQLGPEGDHRLCRRLSSPSYWGASRLWRRPPRRPPRTVMRPQDHPSTPTLEGGDQIVGSFPLNGPLARVSVFVVFSSCPPLGRRAAT